MNKQKVITANYLQEFSCVAANCSDSCCRGNWHVDIDEKTYKRYKKLGSPFKGLVEKYVTRNRSQSSSETYARLKFSESACPFLDQKGYCQIQLDYGEDYLSNICATYPRITNQVNGILEKSATVSCPETARLVLLNPAGVMLEATEESTNVRNLIHLKINTDDHKWVKKGGREVWNIRIQALQILQDRRYSLEDRLLGLGIFLQRVEEAINNKESDKIPELLALFSSGYDSLLQEFEPGKTALRIHILHEFHWIQAFPGFSHLQEADMAPKYMNSLNKFYLPFMKEYSYILENYLVNHAFQTLFPLKEQQGFFDCYIRLLLLFSMLQTQLIGLADDNKGLSVESAVQTIQLFSKLVEHRSNYIPKLASDLSKFTSVTIESLSVLLR
ncbi:MAG: flagellin lysine-N-methylase [Negativicutes bacterium]|nr:flagellin lysine-N-methylase [Negativicutes bacterium]